MMVESRQDMQVAIIARFEVVTFVLTKIQVWDITSVNWLNSHCIYDYKSLLLWMGIVPPASGSSSEHRVTS
jgi:hypothetical protein